MLAEEAFLILIIVVAAIAALIGILVLRPAWRRVERACDQIDEIHTVSANERRQAESELGGEQENELRQQ
jgi:hypothetical protein